MTDLPPALSSYPPADPSLWATLATRVEIEPFNAVATLIFLLAVAHTFAASRFVALAHRLQQRHDAAARARGELPRPTVAAEALHFLGEVEVVFGLWALVVFAAATLYAGWESAQRYIDNRVTYTEPVFVVVIMTLASTRPIIMLAESILRRLAALMGGDAAAWWLVVLTVGPILGSFITEPGAMTICALLLMRQFYPRSPGAGLAYATLGTLFVNVSIGGTLTSFAAPPVLMVARAWNWDTTFMATRFGLRAVLSIVLINAVTYMIFKRQLKALNDSAPAVADDTPDEARRPPLPPTPWVTLIHVGFMVWSVLAAHHSVLLVAGLLFFLGFAKVTSEYQSPIELRTPLLVGFFLAGLVIHGGLQGWWIAPVLERLSETPLFFSALFLTAFNDNALITYLATLVPSFEEPMKHAVVQGAVVGGGLTVIANAPNPAGQAILGRFFEDGVMPLRLLLGALLPTAIAAAVFRLI